MVQRIMIEKIIVSLFICLSGLVLSQDEDISWKKAYVRTPPKDMTVWRGEEIVLSCGVMGYPKPTVTWYKDLMKLISVEPRIIRKRDDALVIRKARRTDKIDDSGTYFCVATNQYAVFYSRNATVTVNFFNKIFEQEPENITVEMHTDNKFKCVPPKGRPEPSVVWYHNGKPVEAIKDRREMTYRDGAYVIFFKRISWEFRGAYQCLATSNEKEVWSEKAYLSIKIKKPNILMNKLHAYVGEQVKIKCQSISDPLPSFSWSKVNGIVPKDDRVYDDNRGEITISSVQYEDAGTYNCTAFNSAGSTSVTNTLTVYPKLKYTIKPIDMKSSRTHEVEFHCAVSGGRKPLISWRYQGNIYHRNEGGSKRIHVSDDNSLIIQSVESKDTGQLECIATDLKKEVKASANLVVLQTDVAPPTVKLQPSSISVPEGNSLELTCEADGATVFKWTAASKNYELLDSTYGVSLRTKSGRSVLKLQKVSSTDTDVYRCTAVGDWGTASQLSNVTIIQTAREPSAISRFQVIDVQARSAKLTWNIPQSPSLAPITSYKITVINSKTREKRYVVISNSQQTYASVTGLLPSTTYLFEIVAVNKIGPSKPISSIPIVTLQAPLTTAGTSDRSTDKLENVVINLRVGVISYDQIEVKWDPVEASRITGFVVSFKTYTEDDYKPVEVNNPYAQTYTITGLQPNTKYLIKVIAVNTFYKSREGGPVNAETIPRGLGASQMLIGLQKVDNENLLVHLTPPEEIKEANEIESYEISCLYDDRSAFDVNNANKFARKYMISGLSGYKRYVIFVNLKTVTGRTIKSKEYNIKLSTLKEGEVIGFYSGDSDKTESKENENGILKVIKEPWFIATVGVLVWLLLLVCVILICCRRKRRKKHSSVYDGYKSSSGLLNTSRDYPNTSLRRNERWNGGPDSETMLQPPRNQKGFSSCCRSQASSLDEDFPNKAEIKPMMTYTRHESIEMRPPKSSNGDLSFMKESNLGVAMKNGYKVDTPLNNEISLRYPEYNSDSNRFYDSDERHHHRAPPKYDDLVNPGLVNLSREPRYKSDSVERRHAEIVRTATKKSFPDADLNNMLETTQQASWKREKPKSSPKLAPKPPGENTLRRQGKTQFKPLPKLEVLDWADGFPDSSKASSRNDGSPSASPKLSSAASVLSDSNDNRPDSRMSHGGSSTSLNKYSRRRKNSNASSMMSSELYQSEMDPSGYSDIYPSEKKKKKEKAAPPPIDLDGLTSDILLQWAESVTNSSPSSSGSSSPSRLSGISSEGSLYTDEDFAQAVAAVVECGGFNMDYDYSIPGMPAVAQQPLSATRNSKMDKIDQVLAQRSKLRQTSTPNKPSDDASQMSGSFIPQISMSNYLTGSHKPASLQSGSSGIPRSTRSKPAPASSDRNRRYGTGFDDVDSVSSTQLTKSNLMRHETSLERDKKDGMKPLTVSNLRHHDSSLERSRNRIPQKLDNVDTHLNGSEKALNNPQLMPEAALSVTSALERNESMNSKDSMNSSSRQDSEVENLPGTSERKPKAKKNFVNISNSSTGTVRSGIDTDSRC